MPKTATDVISEKNDLARTIGKDTQVLNSGITEMMKSIIKIGNQLSSFNI